MNEREFEEFIARCVADAQLKNDALDARHGLYSFARWDADGDRETLTLSNPGEPQVLEAHVTSIGSYSLQTHTWLWAWANESLTDSEREKARRLKNLHARTGIRLFADAHFDCDEELAWKLAAAAIDELASLGCYREPVGHLWVFVSIDAVASIRRHT